MYPQVVNPDEQRKALADAEAATTERDAGTNAAEQRRIDRNLGESLEAVLTREFKIMLAYPVGGDDKHAMRVSERTALLTAGVKLLAVTAKIPPKTGEGLDEDAE
jgi:hypothetical protein